MIKTCESVKTGNTRRARKLQCRDDVTLEDAWHQEVG